MKGSIPPAMVKWTLWALWGLIVGSAVLWACVGSVGYWVRNGWLPADSAGWVQAIGGIGAIVGAFVISRLEGHRQRREWLQEQLATMHKAFAAASYAVACFQTHHAAFLDKAHGTEEIATLSLTLFNAAHVDMQEISIGGISDFNVANKWTNVRRSVRLVIAILEGTTEFDQLTGRQAKDWAKSAEEDLDEMQSAIEDFAQRHPQMLT